MFPCPPQLCLFLKLLWKVSAILPVSTTFAVYNSFIITKKGGSKMQPKTIAIVGAGPGGLMTALLLSAKGYEVTVIEKQPRVGGRSQKLTLGPYHFDVGPTFFTLPAHFIHLMNWAGFDYQSVLHFQELSQLYTVSWPDQLTFTPTKNQTQMLHELTQKFPQQVTNYQHFQQREIRKFQAIWSSLSADFQSPLSYLRPTMLKSAPHLHLSQSLARYLKRTFNEPRLEQALGFQAKYLGMAPEQCPALFSMLSLIERHYGLYHVIGGLNQINEVLAEQCRRQGVTFLLNTEVTAIHQQEKKITGLTLANEQHLRADAYVLNADFAKTIPLLDEVARPHYSNRQLQKKKYSLSTIVWYFGLDCPLPLAHHHFCLPFPENKSQKLIYLHNPSQIDPTLAPPGHSSLYALMPVENRLLHEVTETELADYEDRLLATLSTQIGFDIRPHIRVQKCHTPKNWEDDFAVFAGAVFNLAHSFDQMLYFRPHNQFLSNLFLVGGGTHPGSGLPTIYESARISSNLIFRHFHDQHFIPKTQFSQGGNLNECTQLY